MRKLQLSILLVLVLVWNFVIAQGTGFIALNGRQFLDKTGAPFFPMVMNYHVNIVHDQGTNPQYKVIRSADYGTQKCVLEGGYSFANCENSLRDDFARISQMGFNTVRITGDLAPYRNNYGMLGFWKWSSIYDFGTGPGTFCDAGRKYFYLSPPYTNAACQTYFNLIGNLMDIADQYDMKVIFLASEASGCYDNQGSEVCFPDRGSSLTDAMDYASYLSELAKVLKDKPALLAYDLYNEPIWEVWQTGRNMDKDKKTICEYVGLWYDAVKAQDPNHLITLGGWDFSDVFNWDTGVMKLDFVSIHIYPGPDENGNLANSPILKEAIINQFHWFTEELGKPWIIGETGFSATDESCLANVIWGDESDQENYLTEILPAVRDCGGSGFSWWLFQEIHWYCVENTICTPTCSYCRVCDSFDPWSVVGDKNQNYFGLQKYSDPDPSTGLYSSSDLKSAAQVSIDFDESNGVPTLAPCDAPTSFYYDPNHFSTLNTNTSSYLTGRIEDQDGNAISNAAILAQNYLYTDLKDPSIPYDDEPIFSWVHTYTNHNTTGNNFTIIPYSPFNPNDLRIVYIKASSVGASKVELGNWNSVVAMNSNLGTLSLNKINFDYDSEIDNIVISTSSLKTNYQAWNTLKLTNTTINTGVTSELVARNEIIIMPNFNAEYGSDVHIYLDETFVDCDDYTGFLRITGPDAGNSQGYLSSQQNQIKLQFQEPTFKFYIQPNPSSGKYKIIIDSEINFKTRNVVIRNTIGEEVMKEEFAGFEFEIDLSNFINGIYFLELFNGEQQFNEKLIKN